MSNESKEKTKYLSVGDKVLVHIPLEDRVSHRAVAKFHGQELKVTFRKHIGRGRYNYTYVYYQLAGAESDYGIPYSFVREWLVPL